MTKDRTIPQACDVVVIGGGPAGSTAAATLAIKGRQVVLFDKQTHPRYSVGENLIPQFWKYADAVGVSEKIEAEGFIKKTGGLISWGGVHRQQLFTNFGYDRTALHVERDRLDSILLENAREKGAQVFEDVAVHRVEVKRPGAAEVAYRILAEKSSHRISCKYVVDASGQSAVLGKQLGIRQIDDGFRFMSVWGYYEGAKYVDANGRAHPHDQIRAVQPVTYITSLEESGDVGWVWYIPLRKSTSVGLVLPLELMKSGKKDGETWEDYFLRTCASLPLVSPLLQGARFVSGSVHVIRDYSYRSSQLAGPGFYLVGDAAGFVDPIFSVGMVMAMFSGYAAAWAIDRSLKSPALEEQCRTIYEDQVGGRLEVARALALPRYKSTGQASELAKQAIQLESADSQDLMRVVSTMTTRPENFESMLATGSIEPGKMTVLQELFLD